MLNCLVRLENKSRFFLERFIMSKGLTFCGGVHPACNKEYTKDKIIREIQAPDQVIIPVLQHIGNPAKPVVKIGDEVLMGQLIAQADGFISSNIYSSVSGKVSAIKKLEHPVVGKFSAIVIDNDKQEKAAEPINTKSIDELSPEEVVELIKKAGIVGMGGASFPTFVKAMVKDKNIDTLLINAVECEPYLTCDYRIMIEKTDQTIKGILALNKAIGAKDIYIGIENNKPLAIDRISDYIKEKGITNIKVVSLATKYPQGGEKQLIKAVLNKEVPPTKLPLDVGCVVQNVGTAYAIYEAIYQGKPLIDRVLTLTGSCVKNPGNFKVKIGTPIKEIIEKAALGFTSEPAKIISGGPMMGMTQYTTDVPVIKGMSGILCLTEDQTSTEDEGPCINCAKCVDVCPMRLIPTRLARAVKFGKIADTETYNIMDCMECGCCTYGCPAHISLVQYVKVGKQKLKVLKTK